MHLIAFFNFSPPCPAFSLMLGPNVGLESWGSFFPGGCLAKTLALGSSLLI